MCRDERFMDGVWDKVRYMEYMEIENRRVRENERQIKRYWFKMAGILSLLSMVGVGSVVFMKDMGVCLALGSVMLVLGTIMQGNIDGVLRK